MSTVIEAPLKSRRPEHPVQERSRPPIVARTLAIAHVMQRMIARGEVADQSDLASRLGFTRARISQMIDLTLLAPDIQEALLFAAEHGPRDRLTERELRRVVRHVKWSTQRQAWEAAQRR